MGVCSDHHFFFSVGSLPKTFTPEDDTNSLVVYPWNFAHSDGVAYYMARNFVASYTKGSDMCNRRRRECERV